MDGANYRVLFAVNERLHDLTINDGFRVVNGVLRHIPELGRPPVARDHDRAGRRSLNVAQDR
jgi:hypothetical protein